MKEIVIRDAKLDDIKELSKVRQQVWSETYRGIYEDEAIDNFDYDHAMASFKEKIESHMLFKVATVNNVIVGYMCFGENISDFKYKDYDYLIHYVHIIKKYQHQGLGTRFFKEILNYATNHKINKFYVIGNRYNYNAHSYYEKMGGTKDYESPTNLKKQDQHIIYIYAVGGVSND